MWTSTRWFIRFGNKGKICVWFYLFYVIFENCFAKFGNGGLFVHFDAGLVVFRNFS